MKRKLFLAAAISVIIVAGLFLGSRRCERELTPEEQIRRVIMEMEQAAEERDRRAFLSHISPKYKDEHYRAFGEIQQIVTIYFLQYDAISVVIKDLDIEVQDLNADVYLSAILVAGQEIKSIKDLLPDNLDIYEFDIKMVKEENEWRVISADWGSELDPLE